MDRLTKRAKNGLAYIDIPLNQSSVLDANENIVECYTGFIADRLAEYEDLEEQGLLIKLPCKIGGTIYDIYEFVENKYSPEMYEYEVDEITIVKDKEGIYFVIDSADFWSEDFGKTVFLTREEAEKALEDK